MFTAYNISYTALCVDAWPTTENIFKFECSHRERGGEKKTIVVLMMFAFGKGFVKKKKIKNQIKHARMNGTKQIITDGNYVK
jgi:hypothetical protein